MQTAQSIKSFKPVLLSLKLVGPWTKPLTQNHQVILVSTLKLRKTEFREIKEFAQGNPTSQLLSYEETHSA